MKRGREYHGCGEEYQVGKGVGDEIFRDENQDFKNVRGEEYRIAGNFMHP